MSGIMRILARDKRGSTAIELGLALPILGVMLAGMVDLSRGFAAKLKLEQAAQSTIETVQQRGYVTSTTSLTDLEDEAEARAGTGAVATATAYRECGTGTSKTTTTLTGTCASGQASARYVSVSIAQSYTPLFGMTFAGEEANGTYSMVGESALRFQ